MKRVTANILVLLGAASFGVLSTLVKLSYHDGFSAAEVTGCQVLFGCIGLWLLNLPTLKQLHGISGKTIGKLLLGGTTSGLTGVFYYLALQSIPASLAVILLFQFTWIGMLVDWMLQKRRPSIQQWLALACVLAGTLLAAGYQTLTATQIHPLGIVLGLLAACSYTGTLQVSERIAIQVPALPRSALVMTGAVIITLIVFPPAFLINGSLGHGLWLWGGLLGLFGVIIPPYLFAKAIPSTGAGMATILGSIELPVVITLSFFVLMEQITWTQWSGVALILLGIFISTSKITSDATNITHRAPI